MLTYSFNPTNSIPLYEALYQYIKRDIMEGVLHAGEHLPSKRNFAKHLGLSTITVENAYAQLISEGFIYSLPKKGYYVADISGMSKIKPVKNTADIQIPDMPYKYTTDLSDNRTNPESFPFSIWAKLLRRTISERQQELMTSSPAGGIYMLRAAIAEHLQSFRGMSVNPDQIIIGAGTEYLYGMLIQLLGKDKIYCVENPGYHKIPKIYKSNGVVCNYIDMNEQGLSVQDLNASNADIVHISPTHHFPTGITMPANRRYELLAWANEKKGRYIIEDDYDSEFRLNGKPIPTLQSMDISDRVIYINTFSKSLASTIRISYMVLPVHLANYFYEHMSFYSCTVSNFEQYTLADFIKDGYFEKHINRMRIFYARKREEVLDCIKKSALNKRCTIIEKDSGLHFLIRLKTDLPDQTFLEILKEMKIHLASLSEYYRDPKKAPEHTFIINYSNLDPECLHTVLKKIARYM